MPDSRAKPPSYNVAPSQLLYVIRENHDTGQRTLELLRWGLIPHGCKDPDGGRKPINARAESMAQLPTFRAAYAKHCRTPIHFRSKGCENGSDNVARLVSTVFDIVCHDVNFLPRGWKSSRLSNCGMLRGAQDANA